MNSDLRDGCYLLMPAGVVDEFHTWHVKAGEAVRLGVANPKSGPGTYLKLKPSESMRRGLTRIGNGWLARGSKFAKLPLGPGEYYPRMARPTSRAPLIWQETSPSRDIFSTEIASLLIQIISLNEMFDRICRTVEPTQAQLRVYGREIGNLLTLASIEVEGQWNAILRANGATKTQLSWKEYAHLGVPMHLKEYAIAFVRYPHLKPIRPFAQWGVKYLPWFGAYGAVKHGRTENLAAPTLAHAAAALAACVVMLVAQFGLAAMVKPRSGLGVYFEIVDWPQWNLSELYVDSGIAALPVNYPF